MTKFKIENFCEEHNEEFKIYYNYLNNPVYASIIYNMFIALHTDKLKLHIMKLIKENHKLVIEKLNKIDIIISFYKQNNLINKSEIGKFFTFYEKEKNNINIKNNEDLHKLFYKLISYENCTQVLKECFYIFSEYRACIYFMTPSINFKNTKKAIIEKVILSFNNNINTLNQIISKIYVGDNNPWGSIYYSTAYSMFETLIIIKKYYNNQKKTLNILNIKFDIKKLCIKKDIIKNLCNNYHKNKLNENIIDNKITENNINNISHFIVILKRLGYDLWFTINLVFDTIFEKYIIKGIPDSLLINHKNIYLQKMNNLLGFKCFILSINNYISNTNIFNNFND
jgi:hypothetical protein